MQPEPASGWVAVRDSFGGGDSYVLGHTFCGTRKGAQEEVLDSWRYYLDNKGVANTPGNRLKWLRRNHGYRFVKAEVRCTVGAEVQP